MKNITKSNAFWSFAPGWRIILDVVFVISSLCGMPVPVTLLNFLKDAGITSAGKEADNFCSD